MRPCFYLCELSDRTLIPRWALSLARAQKSRKSGTDALRTAPLSSLLYYYENSKSLAKRADTSRPGGKYYRIMRRRQGDTLAKFNASSAMLAIGFGLWFSLACAGMAILWHYSTTPGKEGDPPKQWPSSSALQREPGTSTIVIFMHPKCPCSRASLEELSGLLAHSARRLLAYVVFLRPPGENNSWTHTDLWYSASKLPDVRVVNDIEGRETRLFHAAVSGATVVYDASGKLTFHGGITGARGHSGDNPGRSAVESYAQSGTATLTRTPVFGCPLFDPNSQALPPRAATERRASECGDNQSVSRLR